MDVRDLISFHAESILEIQGQFELAVDDFVDGREDQQKD